MESHCATGRAGFTVIELVVVLGAIAVLLSIAVPRYVRHVDHAREVALRHNLKAMRDAIDRFHADRGRHPESLQDLVDARYLRSIPLDPLTERFDSWQLQPAEPPEAGIRDVHSGARGSGTGGMAYAQW
ncbi:MAG: prepilin-type N-terminal cleavage/methylation domain-containing protein [Rubrivivax sp.]